MNAVSTALATGPFVQYVTIAAVALTAWSGKAAFLMAVLLATDLVNPQLKRLSAAVLPGWLTDRPSGCGSATGEKVSCDIFPRFGACSDTKGTGFPSGHCQSMAVVASFVTRSVLLTDSPTFRKAMAISAAWLAAALVFAQRLVVRCHSVPQVVAGVLVGSCTGWLASAAADRLFDAPKSRSPAVKAAGA